MIQFNLLPDIKLEYIKAQRTKRMVITISSLVSAVSLVLVIGLVISVFVFQKQHMNGLTADIAKYSKDLQGTEAVNKILTVQSQLAAVTPLHDQKQAATRIMPFIQQLTPTDVSISSLSIDFETQIMTLTGSAESPSTINKLASVNRFVDTLKFTDYKTETTEEVKSAFSEVVLTSFGRSDKGASYSIDLKFDPLIFTNTEKISLQVPSRVTTRSSTESPNALFEPTTGAPTGGVQ